MYLGNLTWTNVKYFTTVYTAVFSFLLYVLISPPLDFNYKLLLPVPVFLFLISFIGMLAIQNQFQRLYQWITVSSKLEDLLDLNKEYEFNILKKDKSILPSSFLSIQNSNTDISTKEYVDDLLKFPHWRNRSRISYKIMWLFLIFMFFSVLELIYIITKV